MKGSTLWKIIIASAIVITLFFLGVCLVKLMEFIGGM